MQQMYYLKFRDIIPSNPIRVSTKKIVMKKYVAMFPKHLIVIIMRKETEK